MNGIPRALRPAVFGQLHRILRTLWREPGFTVPSVTSLALAIGIATTVFSAVNSVLLRPLNLPHPDRLAMLWGVERDGGARSVVSFADFEDWRKNSRAFESAAAYTSYYKPVLTRQGPPERLSSLWVSHDYFAVLEAKPFIGRFFRPDEDFEGRDDVVVLSYDLWRDRFHGDRNLLGKRILLDSRPETVVGIAGPDLAVLPTSLGGRPPQLYRAVGEQPGEKSRDSRHLRMVVRLKPGVTVAQAQSELNVLCRQMERAHPDTDAHLAVRIVPVRDDITRNLRSSLIGLQLSIFAVVLIACANIANLLLARSARRQREWAIRGALGASTSHIVRLLLAESLVLSFSGGTLGLLLAFWGRALLEFASHTVFPDTRSFPFDFRVLLFAAGLAVGTGVAFGLAPIGHVISRRFARALTEGGRSIAGTPKQDLRRVLAAAQIAVALVLLISAGLLTRSFLRLRSASPGFDAQGVLTAGITLPQARFRTDESRVAFFNRLLPRLHALPGVKSVALVTPLPLSGDFDGVGVERQGKQVPESEWPMADRYVVTPDYFDTLRIPLVEGRSFDKRDDATRPYVALINRTAARVLFAHESPIGKKIRVGAASVEWEQAPFREIVGVVRDVEQYGLGMPVRAQIYVPHAQFAVGFTSLVLRTAGDPNALAQPLRRVVLNADPEQPIDDVVPFPDLIEGSLAARRFGTWILGGFAVAAVFLAMIGIYGVISYGVAARKQEFAIRMALGARAADISWAAISAVVPILSAGIFGGVAGAWAARQWLHRFLFGIGTTDPGSFIGMPLLIALVAILACYLPAKRAAQIEAAEALKCE